MRFAQSELWPEVELAGADDTVDVEIYESWLLSPEAAEAEADADAAPRPYGSSLSSASCPPEGHGHGHGHAHGEGETHVHLSRPEVEANAVRREGPPSPGAAS